MERGRALGIYDAIFSTSVNQGPALRTFLNETTTVTYGQVMVWNTTTVYDATESPPIQFGLGATLATNSSCMPAGIVWGFATGYLTTTVTGAGIPASGVGLLVHKGIHPHAYIFGSATFAHPLWVAGGHPSALFGSSTTFFDAHEVGRTLATAATTVTQQLAIWVRL